MLGGTKNTQSSKVNQKAGLHDAASTSHLPRGVVLCSDAEACKAGFPSDAPGRKLSQFVIHQVGPGETFTLVC